MTKTRSNPSLKQLMILAILEPIGSSTTSGIKRGLRERSIVSDRNCTWQMLEAMVNADLISKEIGGPSRHGRQWHRYTILDAGRELLEKGRKAIA